MHARGHHSEFSVQYQSPDQINVGNNLIWILKFCPKDEVEKMENYKKSKDQNHLQDFMSIN